MWLSQTFTLLLLVCDPMAADCQKIVMKDFPSATACRDANTAVRLALTIGRSPSDGVRVESQCIVTIPDRSA